MDAAVDATGLLADLDGQTKDGFACHLVPRAITRKNAQQYVVTATVVFTPMPLKQAPGPEAPFEKWPSWIEERLRSGISIHARPALSPDSGKELGKARSLFTAGYDALVKKKKAANRKAVLDALDAIWSRWFEAGFPVLRDTLWKAARRDAGQAFKEMKLPDRAAPDILSVPRSELGRKLVLTRTVDLFENLKNAKQQGNSSLRRMRSDWLRRLQARPYKDQPWAKTAPADDKAKATPVAGDAGLYDPFRYEGLEGVGQDERDRLERIQKELQTERLALDAKLALLLEKRRRSVSDFATFKKTCDESTTAEDLYKALRSLANKACPAGQEDAEGKCLNQPGEAEKELNEDLAVQVASTLPDHGTTVPPISDFVVSRWHGLQAINSLARLVHLVVDIAFDIDIEAEGFDLAKGPLLAGHHYLEFAVRSDDVVGQRLWTLTKLRLPAKDGETGHCWPATVEEWATVASGRPLERNNEVPLDSVDGVLDLEATLLKDGTERKRYDVLTVDAALAAEAEIKRQRAAEDAKDLKATSETLQNEEAEIAETANLKTAGFQLIDTWRQAAVVHQFLASCDQTNRSDRRVDAKDLRVGFKMDVGAFVGGPQKPRLWRSLTDREILYEDPDGTIAIDDFVDAFLPETPSKEGIASLRRRELDGAVLNAGTRVLQNHTADPDNHRAVQSGFAEPTIATWDGDPLGQRPGELEGKGGAKVIPVSQTASLSRNSTEAPFRQIFGRAYAFGLREVLMGGCAVPLSQARERYEAMSSSSPAGMAYPGNKDQILRCLRHERILAPMVAVEADHLIGEFKSERAGFDGKLMVVRSQPEPAAVADENWRFGPSDTARVLFAPTVDLAFAVRHGVTVRTDGKGEPIGGVQDLDYDADWGGFPVYDPATPPIPAAIRSTYFPDEVPKKGPRAGMIINGESVPRGFAAVRSRQDNGKREVEYYPDPAARHLVIALRRANASNGYLSGNAICVPIYPGQAASTNAGTPGYPDARPVVLRLRTCAASEEPLSSYDDVRRRAGIKSDHQWPSRKIGTGRCKEITIHLAPGEDYEIETWCVPDMSHLLAWFDLPEGLAQLSAAQGHVVKEVIANATHGEQPDWPLRRGDRTLAMSNVREAAQTLHDVLLYRPLPEIASVRRLRMTHASGLPKAVPMIAAGGLKLLRTTAEDAAKKLEPDCVWVPEVPSAGLDGGREILIDGKVTLDVDSTETIELYVEAASPKGEPFDDPRRGRSFDERARGNWPRTRRTKEGTLQPVLFGDAVASNYMRELYGFYVEQDGRASLGVSKSMLAKWRVPVDEKLPVELLTLTRRAIAAAAGGQSPIERLFSDTKARRLVITPAATSRTSRHIPARRLYPTERQQEIDEDRLYRYGTAVKLVLRATERPAALTAKALLPAFAWQGPDKVNSGHSRRTKIRIRLNRPWWTSGEEERLGIVVWPPNILNAKDSDNTAGWTRTEQTQGIVRRVEPELSPTELNLETLAVNTGDADWRAGFFSDADLGPGGKYVTRWGDDPINDAGSLSWFIPADAFRDVKGPTAKPAADIDAIEVQGNEAEHWDFEDRHKPRFVKNVLMPIPDEDGKTGETAGPKLPAHPEFMMVSLVTFEPRFDPDFEHWYVDVDLDVGASRDPFVRFGLVRFQPHAARNLQVSAPEVKWVQVVSYDRRATLERVAQGQKQCVRVMVHGPSGHDLQTDQPPSMADAQSQPPNFRATLIEVRRTPTGQIVERVAFIAEKEAAARGVAAGPVIVTDVASAGTSVLWTKLLPLPDPKPGEDEVSYAVMVEEFLTAQRTTFSNEPIRSPDEIKPEERSIESGPRFAVRISVE